MIAISSQDYRNVYEKFYNQIRNYLWPYQVLEILSDVEMDIYSAFIDVDKLRIHFGKLKAAMKDVLPDDELLEKYTNKMTKLLEEEDDATTFFRLYKVSETDPDKPKNIKTMFEDKKEEEKAAEQVQQNERREELEKQKENEESEAYES